MLEAVRRPGGCEQLLNYRALLAQEALVDVIGEGSMGGGAQRVAIIPCMIATRR